MTETDKEKRYDKLATPIYQSLDNYFAYLEDRICKIEERLFNTQQKEQK